MFNINDISKKRMEIEEQLHSCGDLSSMKDEKIDLFACSCGESCSGTCSGSCDGSCSGGCSGCGKS